MARLTIKQLEERLAQAEAKIAELQSQLLTLALRPQIIQTPVTIPNTNTPVVPLTVGPALPPSWPPYTPYVGDPPYQQWPTVTCSTTNLSSRKESKDSLWRD